MCELAAHQLSTVTGLCFFSIFFWFLIGAFRLESSGQALGGRGHVGRFDDSI